MPAISSRLVAAIVCRCPYIGDAAKVTLLLLHEFAGQEAPPQRELAALRDKSLSNFQRDLDELRSKFILQIDHEGRLATYRIAYLALMDSVRIPKNRQHEILKGDAYATREALRELQGMREAIKKPQVSLAGHIFKTALVDYNTKKKNTWTAEDLGHYFRDAHKAVTRTSYPVVGQHEREAMRKMIRTHGAEVCVTLVDYYLKNWRGIEGVRVPNIVSMVHEAPVIALKMEGQDKDRPTSGRLTRVAHFKGEDDDA